MLESGTGQDFYKANLRGLANLIQSINDNWGIFSRTKIQLLPHQLWVCRKTTETWPARWLVADDVGLGKTIEAGLILLPLIERKLVSRFLVICPASLVEQWQERFYDLFDIRMTIYQRDNDNKKYNFWNANDQIIVSLQTLRTKNEQRRTNLFESDTWDLVIVDEAHHLNADEKQGPTLGYQVLHDLINGNKVNSMYFFTGTPHRGKDFGFFSLLHLLRPDLFDPKKEAVDQIHSLKQVLIRNNKQNVTNLNGEKLFQEPLVSSITYTYSDEENRFYELMTDFISTGKTYAGTLSGNQGSSIILVLISLQKLASSSIAAIRQAFKKRIVLIKEKKNELLELKSKIDEADRIKDIYIDTKKNLDMDAVADLEESKIALLSFLQLMKNEEERMEELINIAETIKKETKIDCIVDLIEKDYPDRHILFFTEYKATQSILVSALFKRFGERCAVFINGDNRLDNVITSDGRVISLKKRRDSASEDFKSGKVRFLVSTEAGGEGIDLQDNCFTLFHVDLPWNPMRMHQRVGRVNRFGQTKQVEVVSFRNPETIESMIWDKLNDKIQKIMMSMNVAMEEPEDLLQLVLGMTDPGFYDDIFFNGLEKDKESLGKWFEAKSGNFGGKNAINTVRELVGNAEKFDFGTIAPQIPKLNLQDMQTFFEKMLSYNGRRVTKEDDNLTFLTPESWLSDPAILPKYTDMVFDRSHKTLDNVIGVGHRLMKKALQQAFDFQDSVVFVSKNVLQNSLFIYRIYDSVTSNKKNVKNIFHGIEFDTDLNRISVQYKDWELLLMLNKLTCKKENSEDLKKTIDITSYDLVISKVQDAIQGAIKNNNYPFVQPVFELFLVYWVN